MDECTIVDTDILIDAARRDSTAVECLDQIERESGLAISVITQLEIWVGCRDKTEMRHTERFLQRFQIVKLNEQISDTTVELMQEYRQSHGLAIPDGLIAATAIVLNWPLISKNQRDYRFISQLRLLPYPLSQGAWPSLLP